LIRKGSRELLIRRGDAGDKKDELAIQINLNCTASEMRQDDSQICCVNVEPAVNPSRAVLVTLTLIRKFRAQKISSSHRGM